MDIVQRPIPWAEDVEQDQGVFDYFVIGHGTLRGPGSYGHMGGSPYVLRLDSIIEMRAPKQGDCDDYRPAL